MSSLTLKDSKEHIEFVQNLINDDSTTEQERMNYMSYMRALVGGTLEDHQGRYVYLSKGVLLDKSFKNPHDVLDHLNQSNAETPLNVYTYSLFIYVTPVSLELVPSPKNSGKRRLLSRKTNSCAF